MAEKDGPEPAAEAPGARERFMGGPVGVVDGLVPTVYNRMVSLRGFSAPFRPENGSAMSSELKSGGHADRRANQLGKL